MTQPQKTKAIAKLLTLPMSGFIRAIVADAKLIAKTPGFKLDMGCYAGKNPQGICLACMGGAAIARRAKRTFKHQLESYSFLPQELQAQQVAEVGDLIRTGELGDAFEVLGRPYPLGQGVRAAETLIQMHIRRTCRRRAPWKTYLKAADMLEAAGL